MDQYKILAAMRDLEEFTISQLIEKTGANPHTVRATIERNRHFIEEVERVRTGKRGGQIIRYRIKADQCDTLKTKLSEIYATLVSVAAQQPQFSKEPTVPLSLLTAEDTLTRRFSDETDQDQKKFLLEMAELDLAAARNELYQSSRTMPVIEFRSAQERLQEVELKRDIRAAELIELSQGPDQPKPTGAAVLRKIYNWASRLNSSNEDWIHQVSPLRNTKRNQEVYAQTPPPFEGIHEKEPSAYVRMGGFILERAAQISNLPEMEVAASAAAAARDFGARFGSVADRNNTAHVLADRIKAESYYKPNLSDLAYLGHESAVYCPGVFFTNRKHQPIIDLPHLYRYLRHRKETDYYSEFGRAALDAAATAGAMVSAYSKA